MASQMILKALYQRGSSLLSANRAHIARNATLALFRSPLVKSSVRLYSGRYYEEQLDESREEEPEFLGRECGANWEILSPFLNRFCFPNKVGPAYTDITSIGSLRTPLEMLVDFDGQRNKSLLHFSVMPCPVLLKHNVPDWFPAQEGFDVNEVALMILRYFGDSEQGAKKFVLAATEIAMNLTRQGFWADFINPFSGKALFNLYDENEYGLSTDNGSYSDLNIHFTTHYDSVSIGLENCSPKCTFTGNIYTNAPCDHDLLKAVILSIQE